MNDNSLTVSPISKRVNLTAGETYTSQLKIINSSSATTKLHYKINILPYGVINEDYLVDLSSVTAYTRILDWITIDQPEGDIEPGKTQIVDYHINVPQDAPDGGQYCALVIQNVPTQDSTTATNSTRISNILEISSLIYAQLGNPTYDGEILGSNIPIFSANNTITTSASVQNTGNVHQSARITTKAYSAFTGKQILLSNNSNQSDQERLAGLDDDELLAEYGSDYYSEIIMPETTRHSFHDITGFPALGAFRITQEISFNGRTATTEQLTIICPIWLIILALISIGSLIALIIHKIKKSRRQL